jgi:hypothetical protein
MKRIVAFIAMAIVTVAQAGPVADGMSKVPQYIDLVERIIKPVSQIPQSYKDSLMKLKGVIGQATLVAQDTEDFISRDIGLVNERGNKLINDFQCKNVAQNTCIANMLEDVKLLLTPIISTLIARQTEASIKKAKDEGKPAAQAAYDGGALLSLLSLDVIPATLRTELRTKVASFVQQLQAALDYADTLGFLIDPSKIERSLALSAADKANLKEVVKEDPIVLPADAIDF